LSEGAEAGRRPSGRFLSLPMTFAGWWSVGLAAGSGVVWVLTFAVTGTPLNVLVVGTLFSVTNVGWVLGWILWGTSGAVAVVAVARFRDRSWLVWLVLVLGVLLAVFAVWTTFFAGRM
jgi:hypothetical protein